jgi:hypothetical protein
LAVGCEGRAEHRLRQAIGRAPCADLDRDIALVLQRAGDADFVPAAKLARREGVDFILDPMWARIPEDLHEHIDGLRATSPRPRLVPTNADVTSAKAANG